MKKLNIKKFTGLFLVLAMAFALLIAGKPECTYAAAGLNHVTDQTGLLSESEISELEEQAKTVSDARGCGVYLVMVEDFSTTSDTIAEYNQYLFDTYDLGADYNGNVIMLTLSMAGRDYDLMAHGDFGNAAFTDYGKEELAESFLDDFGNDEWKAGFSDFISECDSFMTKAENGEPVDIGSSSSDGLDWVSILIRFLLVPLAVALVITLILNSKMKNVHAAVYADTYVTEGGMKFTRREDFFTHVTETRHKIEKDHGGGTSVDSCGSSHSSGNF